jgi:hypothetical protein
MRPRAAVRLLDHVRKFVSEQAVPFRGPRPVSPGVKDEVISYGQCLRAEPSGSHMRRGADMDANGREVNAKGFLHRPADSVRQSCATETGRAAKVMAKSGPLAGISVAGTEI